MIAMIKNVAYFIFSYLLLFQHVVLAQIDTTDMDRMNKFDLLAGKATKGGKVISASRSNQNVNDLPIAIQVITREEIERNGYVTLVDVLKHIGGIRTSKPGTGIDGETFLMRGLVGNYYTKILINSIPIQPSVSGNMAIAEQLPIIQAERIEIIFGPASAIYGGDAMAGVINIITRSTDNNPFAQATITTGEYGYRCGSFIAGGKAGKNSDVVKYTIYSNFSERQDLNVRYDAENYSNFKSLQLSPADKEFAIQNPVAFLGVLQDNYPYYKGDAFNPMLGSMPQRSHLIGGQMEYRGFQGSYLEMSRQNFYSTGITPILFGYNNPDTFYGDRQRRVTLSYNGNWGKWSITSNLSYNHYRLNPQSSRASTYRGFNGRSYKYAASNDAFAEQLFRYTTTKKWEWTLGASYQYSSTLPETNDLETPFNPNDYKAFRKFTLAPHPLYGNFGYNQTNFSNVGLFLQGIYVKNRWSFIYGGRQDYNSLIQGRGRVRLALQYKVNEKLSLRSSGGGAFKIPAPNLIYSSTALPSGIPNKPINYQQVPNTNLKPEELDSREFGMRYQINRNTSLEIVGYMQNSKQRLNNFILPVDTLKYPLASIQNPSSPIPFARVYKNDSASRSRLLSLQILFKQRDIFKFWHMNLDANITLSSGDEILPNGLGSINGYRAVPFFMGQVNVDCTPHKNWYVRLESVMSSKWHRRYIAIASEYGSAYNIVKGYATLDMVARYKWSKNVYTCLKILNVFNTQYGGIDATGLDIDLRYNPQLGRNIQLGVNFNLD